MNKFKKLDKRVITIISIVCLILVSAVIAALAESSTSEIYGNESIISGDLYFMSKNQKVTSIPVDEPVSLHVFIGLSASATSDQYYVIDLDSLDFDIYNLNSENKIKIQASEGNIIEAWVRDKGDGTGEIVISGWKSGTTLSFNLTGEFHEKGKTTATMATNKNFSNGKLTAEIESYGENLIEYSNSKNVNYNSLYISPDGTVIKDASGNDLSTNNSLLEYTLRGTLVNNPDNETITKITVNDTLTIPSGINIEDLDTLKSYLSFSGIDENDIKITVGTTDGTYIRKVNISYTLDSSNEINNYLYSDTNKMYFDVVNAIKNNGTNISKGTTITLQNELESSYESSFHKGTADKVSAETTIEKEPGSKFDYDKEVDSVKDNHNTWNAGQGFVVQGDEIKYRITIDNSGSETGKVNFTDWIPIGTEFVSAEVVETNGASDVTWAKNEYDGRKIEGSATINKGGKLVLAVTVKVTGDNNTTLRNELWSNNTVVDYADVPQKKKVDLAISKVSDNANVNIGDTITYTIKVTNNGIMDTTTDVVDFIPDGFEVTDSNGGTITTETDENGNNVTKVTWSNVTIRAGETITYTLVGKVKDNAPSTIINKVYVDKDGENEKWDDDYVYVIDPEQSTTLTKLVNGSSSITASYGDQITYTISLRNTGVSYNLDDVGGKIVVKDTIPSEISWDSSKVYYEVNGTKYTDGIEINGNDITWTYTGTGLTDNIFSQWKTIKLYIPGTVNVKPQDGILEIRNTAKSETLDRESTAIIYVKPAEKVDCEKYVYRIYDDKDSLIYQNTTGGKVDNIDTLVRENYTVVYRVKIKNIGENEVKKLVLNEYASDASQLLIDNSYYTQIDVSDTSITTDNGSIVVKQYDQNENYIGWFTTPYIYYWGSADITTEDYKDRNDYTRLYSDGIGEFSLSPNQEITWEYSMKTSNTEFYRATNYVKNKEDNVVYPSETLYAPKGIKSIEKGVALTDIDNISTANTYKDRLSLLYKDVNNKYFMYKLSVVTEGYLDETFTINDVLGNTNLKYVTDESDSNLPIVNIKMQTYEGGFEYDFNSYKTTINGNNMQITITPPAESTQNKSIYYTIYYLVKLDDNAKGNITSINTASITIGEKTVSDTAEVVILEEQTYPGLEKKFQGVYFDNTTQKDETGYNPRLTTGATEGAHIVWNVSITNAKATNAKDMLNYTIQDVLPTLYSYDDTYRNNSTSTAKYYPSIIIYDDSGKAIKTINAYDSSSNGYNTAFIEPEVTTITENGITKNLIKWNFNGDEYKLQPGYKMVITFSTKVDTPSAGKFINNAYLTIKDGFLDSNVCSGTVKYFNGEKAINAQDSITTYSAIITTSYKEVETLYDTSSPLYGYASSNNKTEQTMKGQAGEDIRYTLNIENNSEDTMKKLVLIDRLPYVGDKYTLTDDNRNSGFSIKYKNLENIKFYKYNSDTKQETEMLLTNGTDYKVEFSNEKQNSFNSESSDWIGGSQVASWHEGFQDGDVNIRITFSENLYINPNEKMVVKLIASIPGGKEIENSGEDHISWNNFGYCYTAVKYEDNSQVISDDIVAESSKVGVWVEEQLTKLKFTKVWNDNNNFHNVRPTEIKIQLQKRLEGETEYTNVGDQITIDSLVYQSATNPNEWIYTFEDLPKYENGKKIEYKVIEVSTSQNYEKTEPEISENDDGFIVKIQNTEVTGKIKVKKKVKYNNDDISNSVDKTFYFVVKMSGNRYVMHDENGNTYIETISSLVGSNKLANALWEINPKNKNDIEIDNLIKGESYQVIEVTENGEKIGTNNSNYNVTYSSDSVTVESASKIEEITITNAIKTKNLEITKIWNDSINTSHRPESIEIIVYAGDSIAKDIYGNDVKVTLNSSNATDDYTWKYIFSNLPVLDRNGNEIIYTIKENFNSEFYNSSIDGTKITNDFTVPGDKITITVNKEWESLESYIPDSIKVVLNEYIDNNLTNTKEIIISKNDCTISNDGTWVYVINNLPKYDSATGKEIRYEVVEQKLKNFEVKVVNSNYEGDSKSITLKNTLKRGSLTVTKKVKSAHDEDITDNMNASYYFIVKSGSKYLDANGELQENPYKFTITTGRDSQHSVTIQNVLLDKEYTVIETDINGTPLGNNTEDYNISYNTSDTVTITEESPNGNVEIINKLINKKLVVTKEWNDNNNFHNIRPTEIKIQLQKRLQGETGYTNVGDPVTISSNNQVQGNANEWTYTFEDLPKYENGKKIEYNVVEILDNLNYNQNVGNVIETEDGYKVVIENTEQVGNIKVNKKVTYNTEDISENIDKTFYFVVKMSGNRYVMHDEKGDTYIEQIDTLIGNKDKISNALWEINPKNTSGVKISNLVLNEEYKVIEVNANGEELNSNNSDYNISYSNNTVTIKTSEEVPEVVITNGIKTKELEITKKWNDSQNTSHRPSKIYVTLYANSNIATDINGNKLENVEINTSNATDGYTWKYTFKNLPVLDKNGNEIIYTISENSNYDFYSQSINGLVITNTFTTKVEYRGLNITKNWDNGGNLYEENFRPETVMFVIVRTDTNEEVRVVTVNKDTNWKYSCNDLLKYNENGYEIEYKVYEVVPDSIYYTYKNVMTLNNRKVIEAQTENKIDYEVTNKFEIPKDTVKITVNKMWESDVSYIPSSITVTLKGYVDTTAVSTQKITINKSDCIVNDDGTWVYVIKNLPKYDSVRGKEITYEITEEKINNFESYVVSKNYAGENKYITLKNILQRGSLTVTKKVKNSQNEDITNTINAKYYFVVKQGDKYLNANGELQDAKVVFTIKAGSESVHAVVIENVLLDKEYTIVETDAEGNEFSKVTKDYDVSYSLNNGKVTITQANPDGSMEIINKLKNTQITINKIWNDNNNEYQLRPKYIKVKLHTIKQNEDKTEEITISKESCQVIDNKWVYVIKDLPNYDDYGNRITYRIEEIEKLDWYYQSKEITERQDGINYEFTITNTEVLGEYSVILRKVDENNNPISDINFNVDGKIYTTDNNGESVVVDKKVIYDDKIEQLTIDEISYTGDVGQKKFIKIKEPISIYITKDEVDNKCKVTGISFDKDSEYNTKIIKDVEIENDQKVQITAEIKDDVISVVVPNVEQKFDMSLKKFITKVDDKNLESREPEFVKGENGSYTYKKNDELESVVNNNLVTYTIRVYNEGNVHGYASVIEDDIPDGLEFVPDNEINKQYKWKMIDNKNKITENANEAIKIWTPYLSKEKGGEGNLIKAFDENTMDTPDYKDIQVVFRVTEPSSKDRIVENKAQIIETRDMDNKTAKDIDSTPNVWINGEDDQDTERVRVKYFDLALSKCVTKAIITKDGNEQIIKTGNTPEGEKEKIAKVDVKTSEIQNVTVKFEYVIRVTNEGEIAGYAKEITDYIPEGLKFVKEDNPNWKEENGKVTTEELKDTLLQPNESKDVTIVLTWINGENNMGIKTNVAEISKDSNEYNTKDIDSTPGNMNMNEDDLDDAQVMITATTGQAAVYIVLTITVLGILVVGIVVVKKALVK